MAVHKTGRSCPTKGATRPLAPKTSADRPKGNGTAVQQEPPPCSSEWPRGWLVTLTPRDFGAKLGLLRPGQPLQWSALPGVESGDVFVIATTAPDRRLRAWARVVAGPERVDEGDWQVELRFGACLERPLMLRTLKEDPGLSHWPALQRVTAGRLEAVPPALWQCLRQHVAPTLTPIEPPREGPVSPPPLRATPLMAPPREGTPWAGLDRGRAFRELARRLFLPQGYAKVELQPSRDAAGIDVIAFRAQYRWSKWVAQLDATGETVDVEAVEDVVRGRAQHGAQHGLLIAFGPVSDAARALADEQQIEVWDDTTLHVAWEALQQAPGWSRMPMAAPAQTTSL